jgi:hypothetical protein
MTVMKKKKTVDNPGSVGRRPARDPDDMVHSPGEELPREAGEMDLDDVVHQPLKKSMGHIDERLADPDDLVHDTGEVDDDDR